MEFLIEYGLFLAKAITIVLAILIVVGGIASVAMRQKNLRTSNWRLPILAISSRRWKKRFRRLRFHRMQ